jgi:hypothetical protein
MEVPTPPLVAKLVSPDSGQHQSAGLFFAVFAHRTVAQSLRGWAVVIAVLAMMMMMMMMTMMLIVVVVVLAFYASWTYLEITVVVPDVML